MPLGRKRSTLDRVLSTFDDFPRTKPIKRSRSHEQSKASSSELASVATNSTEQTSSSSTRPRLAHSTSQPTPPTATTTTTKLISKTTATPTLDEIGILRTLHNPTTPLDTILDVSSYIRTHLFSDLPASRTGLSSTRTASLLNFRLNLPPLMSVAHAHALAPSPSAAERAIAAHIRAGQLRRINIPLRGSGTASVSDLLIATADVELLLKRCAAAVSPEVRRRFLAWLRENPFATELVAAEALDPGAAGDGAESGDTGGVVVGGEEAAASLLRAGFLTVAAGAGPLIAASTEDGKGAAKGSKMALESIANAASGSADAVGGRGGSLAHGGGGAGALQVRPSMSSCSSSSSSAFPISSREGFPSSSSSSTSTVAGTPSLTRASTCPSSLSSSHPTSSSAATAANTSSLSPPVDSTSHAYHTSLKPSNTNKSIPPPPPSSSTPARSLSHSHSQTRGTLYRITVPNAGAYLKLLLAARAHIVDLVRRSSSSSSTTSSFRGSNNTTSSAMPVYLLKEQWESGIASKATVSRNERVRIGPGGAGVGGGGGGGGGGRGDGPVLILPGQTKKWKSFHGMRFEWAFEEAFAAGLLECFETRSVGLGVRIV